MNHGKHPYLISESVFTQCVPWRRFASCHTTTRWRMSSRRGMPNTRLSSVILSSVFSPVAMLYTGSSFTGNANGSSSGFSTPHAYTPSPPSFGASSEKSSIVRLAGICRFFNSGFSSYSLSVLI